MDSSDSPRQKSGKNLCLKFILKLISCKQESNICGPDKENCVKDQTFKDKSCLIPCTGLHADIADDSLRQTTQALEQNVLKGSVLF